ncbi:MAG: TRAP transporter substrate-binding protein [Xanthobacteraceae bacterium]
MLQVLALSVAITAAGTLAAAAADEKPVELKLSHWMPATHPLHKALEDWAVAVENASSGTIRFTVHPAERLGKAQAHYDLVREGVVDVAFIEPGSQLAEFPIFAAAALPLLISNAKGGSAALDEWYRAYADREVKEVKFCLVFAHEPGTLHSRSRKIFAPGDLRGLRVRVPNTMIGTLISRLGGTSMSAPEAALPALLGSGAEAAFSPWDSVLFFDFERAVKYHLDAPLYVSPIMLVINKARFAALTQAQKKAVDAHCSTPWAVKLAAPWAEVADAARRRLNAAPGHEVYGLTPAQTAAWRTAAKTMQESWALNARKTGIDPEVAMDGLKALLDKYKAGY